MIAPAKKQIEKPRVGKPQIHTDKGHRFIRKNFKIFVFIRVYLCPSVVKKFAEAITMIAPAQ